MAAANQPSSPDLSDTSDLKKSESINHSTTGQDDERYLSGIRLYLVFAGMLLSLLLVSLDQTIIGTALPVIASKFNAFDQITWVAIGSFLTQTGLMLTYGQLLSIAPAKWVYLAAVCLFEIGLLFSGVAPNVEFLIVGRAITGMGSAGMIISVLSVLAQVAKLEHRPILLGSLGVAFGFASIVGPLLGGAFTDHVSWRWCFYINLPLGAITIATIWFLVPKRPALAAAEHADMNSSRKWLSLDWVGAALALAMIISLVLPLQWGGSVRPWNDKVIIALFCVFAVLLPVFLGWEWKQGSRAIVRLGMFRRRTQIGTCIESFFIGLALLLGSYYLPVYFQAAKGHSATRSGVLILPFTLSIVFGNVGAGVIIKATGRYWPFLFGSPLLISLGCGLLYTLDLNTGSGKEVGYQILLGVGIGCVMQNTVLAVQAEYAKEADLVPQATSLVAFSQFVGGVIGIAIAGTVLANELSKYLALYVPDLSPELSKAVRQSVAVISSLPKEQRDAVLHAYIKALNSVFLIGVPTGVLASLSSLLTKTYDLKAAEEMQHDGETAA